MLNIIMTAVNAIAPMVLLIGLGYILKQKGFFTKEFLKIGNTLVFRYCMPTLLFINIYGIENLQQMNLSVAVYCVAITMVLFALGYTAAVLVTKVPDRRGVLLQCTFRSNFAVIGLALASALGGAQAVANAAIVTAVIIPLYNILGVISLTMFMGGGDNDKDRIKSILMNIAKNPMILGVLAAMSCVLIRQIQQNLFGRVVFSLQRDLTFVYTAINNLKSLTTPFALILLGGQFEFGAVKSFRKEIVTGTLLRIVIAPAIGIGLAIILSTYTSLISFDADTYPALIALYGSPVAVTSAVMAGAMGNDEQLASQLVVWTSVLSIATIFVQVCMMMYMGLIRIS